MHYRLERLGFLFNDEEADLVPLAAVAAPGTVDDVEDDSTLTSSSLDTSSFFLLVLLED
jgi:hypothetical protein